MKKHFVWIHLADLLDKMGGRGTIAELASSFGISEKRAVNSCNTLERKGVVVKVGFKTYEIVPPAKVTPESEQLLHAVYSVRDSVTPTSDEYANYQLVAKTNRERIDAGKLDTYKYRPRGKAASR
jgi:hypothetical protein